VQQKEMIEQRLADLEQIEADQGLTDEQKKAYAFYIGRY
jgi:hypothetical protein